LSNTSSNPVRRIVVVLGMHRSGTSATMNVLNALGVPLSDDLMPPTQFNEKGYFESQTIARIHDDILKSFGQTWSSSSITTPLPPQWWKQPAVAAMKQQLIAYVDAQFEKAGAIWGFKDPRTARMLPLWNEIVADMGLDPKFVLVSRHPRDCAQSLFARERVNSIHAELLWLEHNADAIAYTNGKIDAIVEYSRWFAEPVAQAQYLIEKLGLEDPGTEIVSSIVADVVSTELRHHETTAAAYELPFSAEFYDALLKRNVQQLLVLTNIFQAAARFTQVVGAQTTRELLGRVNDGVRTINERGQRIVSLEGQVRALQASLQTLAVRSPGSESGRL
jgi:hypothetical protein